MSDSLDKFYCNINTLRSFLEKIRDLKNNYILFHTDCDGICSLRLLSDLIKKTNSRESFFMFPKKGENAYSDETKCQIQNSDAESLSVLDLKIDDMGISDKIPVLYIDHHNIIKKPADSFIIWSDNSLNKNTSSLLYETASLITDIKDLRWLALLGLSSDFGDKTAFDIFSEEKKNIHKKDLDTARSLINSASRHKDYDIVTAVNLVNRSNKITDIISGIFPETQILDKYRNENNLEFHKLMHIRPKFMWKVALIEIESAFNIQGHLAQAWFRTTKEDLLIVANSGYIKDRVYFVIKTESAIDVLKFIDSVKPKECNFTFAFGSGSSAGGWLSSDLWKIMKINMKFKS